MNKPCLITVIGPTAIGKTALAIDLAQHFGTEIISSDSRQFFKEMRIGTAVPEPEELQAATHHFIQHLSVTDPYSVGDFERDALELLEELFRHHDKVIMAGGSGLYVKAVTEGLDDFPQVDSLIREKLNRKLENEGIESLQSQLKNLDPDYYERVDLNNPHRLIRALEISQGTGRPYSWYLQNKTKDRPFQSLLVGLTADRDVIYERINERVDLMMEKGLLEEVKTLKSHSQLNALQTVGYKELFEYLEGNCSLDEAVGEIKKNTRRFAKRQLTWFRKLPDVLWFDYRTPRQDIISAIEERLQLKE
ncbi:tRNA (adenosine(37)-N6)-dimethylallyltransferase MiaA [Robertkochia aurantiaca]|uniref:tRNA (adenosine(37)-N6)-dimethylallyltransferase MiaA n=1 Tax=Robertkochia aurantiaca TaxID=2873700 RepID=UPI001CCD129F|nr:tRNA (adenosine(37)-N6)-dimethylallyltransferase MiaA [Robertkochia sp. 3YJGBD-33]